MVIAIACDYRVGVDAGAQTGLTEARAGIPFPAAPMIVVQAELAPSNVRRLVLGARNVDPNEALAAGILDELVPRERVLQRAKDVARELGAAPRDAYARIKHQLRADTLSELRRIVSENDDPLLSSWIKEGGATAVADLLRTVRSNG